jgi:hypothetical protein
MSFIIIDNLDAYAYNTRPGRVRAKSLRERFYPSRGLSMPKKVLITGASSGVGRDMAETLLCAGHTVYASTRRLVPTKPTRRPSRAQAKVVKALGLSHLEKKSSDESLWASGVPKRPFRTRV